MDISIKIQSSFPEDNGNKKGFDCMGSKLSATSQHPAVRFCFPSFTDWLDENLFQVVRHFWWTIYLDRFQLQTSAQANEDTLGTDRFKCILPDCINKGLPSAHIHEQFHDHLQNKTASTKEKKIHTNAYNYKSLNALASKENRLIGRTPSLSFTHRFFKWIIFCAIWCHASAETMSMSVDRSHFTFNEPISVLCIIKHTIKCNRPSWLYGTVSNNFEFDWKVIARKDKPFTDQYIPSFYNASFEVTYTITILKLQPHDVGAWLRCECDTHNNITKRLIQINDKLTVNPEIFNSSIVIIKKKFNITTFLTNVYPEPRNCTLSINKKLLNSFDRTYCSMVKKPDLLNATFMGLFDIPSTPCNQSVTVTCYIGDQAISKNYPLYYHDGHDTCNAMTSSNLVVTVVVVTIIALICLFCAASLVYKYYWTRKPAYGKTENEELDQTLHSPFTHLTDYDKARLNVRLT